VIRTLPLPAIRTLTRLSRLGLAELSAAETELFAEPKTAEPKPGKYKTVTLVGISEEIPALGENYTTQIVGGVGTYALGGGTSCAAPVVSGVAALMLSVNPKFDSHTTQKSAYEVRHETAHFERKDCVGRNGQCVSSCSSRAGSKMISTMSDARTSGRWISARKSTKF
jgi:subtilisin family serine protease